MINKVLQSSVLRCFDGETDIETYDKAQRHHKPIGKAIEVILGNLALFLVDDRDACDLSDWLGSDLSELYIELRVRTLGGVELFIAKRQQRSADLKLSDDQKTGSHLEVTGRHLIIIESNLQSWNDSATLNDLQRTIWTVVFDEDERQDPLDEDDLEELQTEIDARK